MTTNVTLSASNRMESISLSINDDEAVELNEHFLVRMEVISETDSPVELSPGQTEIVILNDDGKVINHVVSEQVHGRIMYRVFLLKNLNNSSPARLIIRSKIAKVISAESLKC